MEIGQLLTQQMEIGQLLTLLLGGGMVATITALFNGVKSLREGSRSKEKDTISDLINRRNKAEEERDDAFDDRDVWRNRAGVLEYTLRVNGIPIPEALPSIPEERK